MSDNQNNKSLQDPNPTKNNGSGRTKPMSMVEKNMQAAIEREEARQAEEKAQMEAMEAERKQDGRRPEYEYEVEGFNIGESLARRAEYAAEKAREYQEAEAERKLEEEVEGSVDEDEDNYEADASTSEDDEDGEEFSFGDDSSDDDDPELSEIENSSSTNYVKVNDKKDQKAKDSVVTEPKLPDPQDDDNKVVPLSQRELPDSPNDFQIDEDDFKDIDLEDTTLDDDDDDDEITDAELEALKEEVKKKLNANIPTAESIIIDNSKKKISVTEMLAQDTTGQKVFDWPLMCSGQVVSMKAFSGPEIEDLNGNISGRNRFNQMKDIYRNLYNHIVSPKPEFEKWLKNTSFLDLDHYYMAAYGASFHGANYIPLSCSNDSCKKVFLTDDVSIRDHMVKFKNEEAEKRFDDILQQTGHVEPSNKPHLLPVSPNIAILIREPSIYNTIFENAVLDQKFIDKYEKMLTMMVYIEAIYYIGPDGVARELDYKRDKINVAKECKYRIATFAKVIRSLSSDAYAILLAEINAMNNKESDVSYQYPEATCPHCGSIIEAQETTATNLLFGRHRLNLITAQ